MLFFEKRGENDGLSHCGGGTKNLVNVYLTAYEIQEGEKKYQKEHQKGLELLTYGLRELYDLSLDREMLSEEIGKGKHGKPFLKNHEKIHFNISHCEGMVVCAFSNAPIGVDVERIGKFRDSVVKKVLTEEEQQFLALYKDKKMYNEMFYRFWTLKESWLKQDGSGFSRSPREVSFGIEQQGEHFIVHCSDLGVGFFQNKIREDYILSICRKGSEMLKDFMIKQMKFI